MTMMHFACCHSGRLGTSADIGPGSRDVRPDFVVFVWFSDSKKNPDVCRIFVVPADIVDAAARESHLHWHKYPRRDGSPRKKSRHVSLTWTGNDTETNISRGFATKWVKYEDAWHLLEN
jgi:hypothetical protein